MNRTRRWIHAALFTSLITAKVFAVEVNVNIKGCITDQKSKEPLIGATVQIVGSSIGAVTDMDEISSFQEWKMASTTSRLNM